MAKQPFWLAIGAQNTAASRFDLRCRPIRANGGRLLPPQKKNSSIRVPPSSYSVKVPSCCYLDEKQTISTQCRHAEWRNTSRRGLRGKVHRGEDREGRRAVQYLWPRKHGSLLCPFGDSDQRAAGLQDAANEHPRRQVRAQDRGRGTNHQGSMLGLQRTAFPLRILAVCIILLRPTAIPRTARVPTESRRHEGFYRNFDRRISRPPSAMSGRESSD